MFLIALFCSHVFCENLGLAIIVDPSDNAVHNVEMDKKSIVYPTYYLCIIIMAKYVAIDGISYCRA